jgi:hypothetical protein
VCRYLALNHPRPGRGRPPDRRRPACPNRRSAELTAEERAWINGAAAWGAAEGAYGAIHRTKPQTAAFALNDSPAGLAALIVEKIQAWGVCHGDIEKLLHKGRDPCQREHLLDDPDDRLIDAHVPGRCRDPA